MKIITWSRIKNQELIASRGISFEDILFGLDNKKLLDDLPHLNKEKYPHQRLMILDIKNYVYVVPYVEDEKKIFLKTIIPSRKATKDYLGAKNGK